MSPDDASLAQTLVEPTSCIQLAADYARSGCIASCRILPAAMVKPASCSMFAAASWMSSLLNVAGSSTEATPSAWHRSPWSADQRASPPSSAGLGLTPDRDNDDSVQRAQGGDDALKRSPAS